MSPHTDPHPGLSPGSGPGGGSGVSSEESGDCVDSKSSEHLGSLAEVENVLTAPELYLVNWKTVSSLIAIWGEGCALNIDTFRRNSTTLHVYKMSRY